MLPEYAVHGEWFFEYSRGDGSFTSRVRKMLAVHAQLPAASRLEGIERYERFRASAHGIAIPKLPDAAALQAGLASHPEFRVVADGLASPRQEIDPQEVLAERECGLYAAFAEENFRPMTCAEFLERAIARRVRGGAANLQLSYHPIFEPARVGLWAVRGKGTAHELSRVP